MATNGARMKAPRFFRCGYAPLTTIPGPIYDNRQEAAARAKAENRYGEYRGRGIKVYECTENGRLIVHGTHDFLSERS
jgi:hypothetical protein